jgi:hypothetical protein
MQDVTEREILAVTQEIHKVVQNIYADISVLQKAQNGDVSGRKRAVVKHEKKPGGDWDVV